MIPSLLLTTSRRPQWVSPNLDTKSIGPFIEKRMLETRIYCRREHRSAVDKPTRSHLIQARASMGKVYLPRSAPWLAEFTHELLTFPASKHDDGWKAA